MLLCLDSSALAKRYVQEDGTEDVIKFCQEADEIFLSVICVPEVLSALNRLMRQKLFGRKIYAELKQNLAKDIGEATIIDLTPSVIAKTVACLESSDLRAMDAIHVACALESGCELFLSADKRQCQAARSVGLIVREIN